MVSAARPERPRQQEGNNKAEIDAQNDPKLVVAANAFRRPSRGSLLVEQAHKQPLLVLFTVFFNIAQPEEGTDKPAICEEYIVLKHGNVWCFFLVTMLQCMCVVEHALLNIFLLQFHILQMLLLLAANIIRIKLVNGVPDPSLAPSRVLIRVRMGNKDIDDNVSSLLGRESTQKAREGNLTKACQYI